MFNAHLSSLNRAMSVFDVIIEYRVSSDAQLITYLCEKKSSAVLLKNLDKLNPIEVVIVVGMVSRMIQLSVHKSFDLYNNFLELDCYDIFVKLLAGGDDKLDLSNEHKVRDFPPLRHIFGTIFNSLFFSLFLLFLLLGKGLGIS